MLAGAESNLCIRMSVFPVLGNSLGIGNEVLLWSISRPEDMCSTHTIAKKEAITATLTRLPLLML